MNTTTQTTSTAETGTTYTEGQRVCGGETEADYDEGTVLTVEGAQVTVGWDSGVTTTQDAAVLRAP